MSSEVDRITRIRQLEQSRDEYARQLEEVFEKMARADERRKIERDNERKWNRILDHLETSMDELKALIAACEGDIIQLTRHEHDHETMLHAEAPTSQSGEVPSVSRKGLEQQRRANNVLRRAQATDPAAAHTAIEKCRRNRVQDLTLLETVILLEHLKLLNSRTDLRAQERATLAVLREAVPHIKRRMDEWLDRLSKLDS